MGMIRCDRCGVYGTAQIKALGSAYYKDFSTAGSPIFITMEHDDTGQLCGACFKETPDAEKYLETVRKI